MKWRGLSTDTAEKESAGLPLRERLSEIRAGIEQYVRPVNRAVNERAIEELRASGIAEKILPVGASAPDFTLQDQNDSPVHSADLLQKGKLVVNFYRGRWCPFCVTELEAWRDALPQVEAAGASLVAISPQLVRHSAFTADQHKLRFPVLSDPGNQVARAFGLVYPAPDYQRALFKSVFINLPHLNGDESWGLPLAATYVIGQDGRVVKAWASADYRERAEPEEVFEQL